MGKKGVVRDKAVHIDVINGIIAFARESGLAVCGLDFSPIRGPEGNIEYLICLKDSGQPAELQVGQVVENAHQQTQ